MSDRRALLRWGLAGTLGAALPGGTAVLASRRTRPGDRPGAVASAPPADSGPPPGAFTVPLAVPAVLRPVSTTGGVDRYEIRQRPGRQRIRPDVETEVWGYDGTFPGPTIEARRGRPVVVTHRNELPVPTVVHLHGAVVPADSDGYPSDFVLPVDDPGTFAGLAEHARHGVAGLARGSRAYTYPNEQPAATLWYHDHRMDFTGPQLYRGLAGCYLVRDEEEDALPLPGGERDLPLMLADRAFDEDGSLAYPALDPTGRERGVAVAYHRTGVLGDTVTVNGVAWPFLEVDAALYRLRFINASNARPYELTLDPPPPGGRGFVQIGSDSGLLPGPVRLDTFLISPGERYDMLVDFAGYPPGTRVTLRNTLGDGPLAYVLRFDVARRVRDEARVPTTLTGADAGPPPPTAAVTADRRFAFYIGPEGVHGPAMVNFNVFAINRIDADPKLGSTEIWDFTADPTHPVHLHSARFRVLSRGNSPPAAHESGWKDTVFIPNGGVRVAVRFEGYRGKYVFHCHNAEHSDAGMMANLEVG